MGHVFWGIGKSHLQLSRHFFCLNKGHQIFSCFSGPWQYIKIFIFFGSGKRRAHHITRVISASSHGNNPCIQSLLHHAKNLFLIQIMKLNRLTGSKMHFLYLILLNHSGYKCHFFLCNLSGSHSQPQHTGCSAFLCIASIVAGKSLIRALIHFSCIKCGCFFPKFGKILLPVFLIFFHAFSFLSLFWVHFSAGPFPMQNPAFPLYVLPVMAVPSQASLLYHFP